MMLSSIFELVSSTRRRALAFVALCALILLANCGPNMRDQAKCQPLEQSSFFPDGKCARDLPQNTVPRGFLQADPASTGGGPPAGTNGGAASSAGNGSSAAGATPAPNSGTADNAQALDFPFPITRDVLSAGHLSYDTFCSPCHGLGGAGNGMIVQRGFPAPPSFHSDRLRNVPPGYIYSVITNGFGRMYSYASRVKPDERWAIVAYIRALQLSENARIEDVPPENRQQLQGATQ
jgi:mono/diheme cytochrome c family protein